MKTSGSKLNNRINAERHYAGAPCRPVMRALCEFWLRIPSSLSCNEKYIEASPRAKWILIAFLFSLSALGLILYQEYQGIEIREHASVEDLKVVTEEYQKLIRYTMFINFLLGLGISPYFIRLGYRTLKLKEYPPPKTLVVFRTKIVGGKRAFFSAIGCFVFGVFIWSGFVLGLYLEYLLHEFT